MISFLKNAIVKADGENLLYFINEGKCEDPPEMEKPESSETAMESEISETAEISVQEVGAEISHSHSIEENISVSVNSTISELSVNDERMSGSHRAKAFILNTENNDWEEIATGICSPEPSEVKN